MDGASESTNGDEAFNFGVEGWPATSQAAFHSFGVHGLEPLQPNGRERGTATDVDNVVEEDALSMSALYEFPTLLGSRRQPAGPRGPQGGPFAMTDKGAGGDGRFASGASVAFSEAEPLLREPSTNEPKLNPDAVELTLFRNMRSGDTSAVLDVLKLHTLLSVGSMGTVYNASLLGQRVVLKVIEHGTGLLKREKERGRLARLEAVVCKQLVHTNIVTTYACHTGVVPASKLAIADRPGGGGGRSAIGSKMVTLLVQEYCARGTLREVLDSGSLGKTRADGLSYCRICAKLMKQVAYALQLAHSLGIVHCDLKAENVLLQSIPEEQRFEGDLDVRAKLGDLGIATVFEGDAVDSGGASMHGTVSHMPPEALQPPFLVSSKTDIWSFGMLMWEMWTGALPFKGLPAQAVVREVREGRMPVWPENTPPVWRSVASRCWSLDPALRPSAVQIIKSLVKISNVLSKIDDATVAVHRSAGQPGKSDGGLEGRRRSSKTPPESLADAAAAAAAALQAAALSDELEDFVIEGDGHPDDPFQEPESSSSLPSQPIIPATPPQNDTVALFLWQMLQPAELKESLQVDFGTYRKALVSPLPYLNSQRFGLAVPNVKPRISGDMGLP